ncbi:MAG TPA: DoxX family protein [Bacteroidales bacterium]|nr:DoxX family protein [Bacteroidales bacterium]
MSRWFLFKFEPHAYALLRVVTGFLFLWHGSQKILDFPHAGVHIPLYIVIIGGGVELFGGFLVMTGLWARYAAFVCSGEMAYAYWYAHGWHAVLPLVNHGEMAMLYCFLFLYISARGSGIFSLDKYLAGTSRN